MFRAAIIIGAILMYQALILPAVYGQSNYGFANFLNRNQVEVDGTFTLSSVMGSDLSYERILVAWDYRPIFNQQNMLTAYVGAKLGIGIHGGGDSYIFGGINPGGQVNIALTGGIVRETILPFVHYRVSGFALGVGFYSESFDEVNAEDRLTWPIATWTESLYFKRIYLKCYLGLNPVFGLGIGCHF